MPKIAAETVAQHRVLTRQALLDAVHSLVTERGVDAVSTGDIAARAGVSRTSIYNYAPDKMTLLVQAIERATAEMRAAIADVAHDERTSAPARLEVILELLLLSFATGTRDILLLRAASRDFSPTERRTAIAPLQRDVEAHIARVVSAGMDAGAFAGQDVELVVGFLSALIEVAIERAVEDTDRAPAVAEETIAFVQRALARK